jgi:integrase
VLTILKAALNHAWREGKVPSDVAWRRAKPFYDVDAPLVRYLTSAECLTLVNATAESFRPMVRAALLSGCRYGELTALRVNDFNADSGTLLIRTSKSGKPRHTILTDEGQRFFTDATNGKSGTDLIFTKSDGKPWGKSHQQRPLTDACKVAKITPAIGFHVLRHTHASTLARQGVPLTIIAAQLGHADSRMTERHYAHLAPSHVADTIRASFPDLGIVPQSNVEKLRASKAPSRAPKQ